MSLNDPQWGRKGGGSGGDSGPPDLDEMWRNFNQRLSSMFGRNKGGGGGGDAPNSPHQFNGAGVIGLIVLVIVVWLASGFYTVDEGQRALVLTFGEHTDTTQPGLRWHMPYPIQSRELVNLSQSRMIELGNPSKAKALRERESLMLTANENIVDIQFAVVYSLKDPDSFQFNVRQQEELVQQVSESAMREIVGKSSMDFVLYEGREQIAEQARKLIQETLDRYKMGVVVSSVQLANAQPPEPVQAAFDDAVKAKQDLERQKSEGQAYYNDVVPKAEGTASRLLEEANGYRQRVVENAEGESSRFRQVLSEYAKAPAVTRERLYLDAMQQILTSTTKVMTDARAGNNMLLLPLDKLLSLSPAAIAEMDANKPNASTSNPTTSDTTSSDAASRDATSRARDALRSRERQERP
jgi:membrane protease subunit HflK